MNANELMAQGENLPAKPDKLDKFKDHLLHQKPLTPNQLDMLEKYRKAFAWRSRLFSPQQVVQMLMEEYRLRYSQAYAIASESTLLFGSVDEIDKRGTVKILIENLYLAMAMAQRDGDPQAMISAIDKIAKLSRAYDDAAPVNVDDMMPARSVQYVQQNVSITNNNYAGEGQDNE